MKALSLVLLLVTIGCCTSFDLHAQVEPSDNIEDLEFDPEVDDPGFLLCDESNIRPEYGMGTDVRSERIALKEFFLDFYTYGHLYRHVSGYVRIRYIVNCNGLTGRFRVNHYDKNYRPADFGKLISLQFVNQLHQFDGWSAAQTSSVDSYDELTLQFEEGRLVKVTFKESRNGVSSGR